ncbi:MAG: HEAT repeat domain-containing protein [Myxococcota bacterium]
MSTRHVWLDHRGAITAMVALADHRLGVVTEHPEGQDTGVYRLDPLHGTLEHQLMPGAKALAVAGETWWVATRDGRLWTGTFPNLTALATTIEPIPTGLALVGASVALIAGDALVIVDSEGVEQARFGLPDRGTAIAAMPNGAFVVVGCRDGTVAVVERQDDGTFVPRASAELHQGPVTALRFERDEPRFWSAGEDRRLLVTHARGALEPIDRSGNHGHAKPVRGVAGDGDRLYTVGDDRTIKAWRKTDRRAPASQQQGVPSAVAVVEVEVDGTAHVAVAGQDASIRLFPVDEEGRVEARTVQFGGAFATLDHELDRDEIPRRQAALERLATYDDREAVERLVSRAIDDSDRALRVLAATHLAASEHPRAIPKLEELIATATDDEVRQIVFEGLRRRLGTTSLRPMVLTLQSPRADLGQVGQRALAALSQLARDDEQAEVRIVEALDHGEASLRHAALAALEQLHPTDATASLRGLQSSVATLRWRALVRLEQRGLLSEAERALRAATEDSDAEVRYAAYLLRLLVVPALAKRLRALDSDTHRQLHVLQTHGAAEASEPPPPPAVESGPVDRTPLLQAMASRRPDTALRAAVHLTLLDDPRALGLLLQLSRIDDPEVQVRACRALQRIGDARALGRMAALLRSSHAPVRDAAFTVIERLLAEAPVEAARIGLSAPHPDVRVRGLARAVAALEATDDSPAAGQVSEARDWLRRALDDDEARVRLDAFKAVVRLQIDGSQADALRFALQSGQSDVRREVITELMSQFRESWAWALLLERLDDPSPELRAEVFGFARQQGDKRETEAVRAALDSRFREMRLGAIEVLAHRVDEVARPWLVAALDDDDEAVRTQAFRALQRTGEARAMVQALESRHRDVRLSAATTLAEAGRPEAEEILLREIASAGPDEDEDPAAWAGRAVQALQGLGWLRSESAVYPARRLLDDPRPAVRHAAARTLAQAASPEVLAAVWNHADATIRQVLATARAWRGDATVAAAVFTPDHRGPDRVAAAVALSDDEPLLAMLDAHDLADRALTQRVVLLLDGFAGDSVPERLIAALTAADFAVRFVAADVLDVFANAPARQAAVVRWLSDAGEGPAWPLDAAFWESLSHRLQRADGRDQAAMLRVLHGMTSAAPHRSQSDAQSAAAKLRHDLDLVDRRAEPLGEGPLKSPETVPDLSDLVLGTYVGLSSQATGATVRASALRRLTRDASRDAATVRAAVRVALTDADAQVRRVAFEALPDLGLSLDERVEEALSAGFGDLGQLALTLLADEGRIDAVWPILTERDDGLQGIAFDLLVERSGPEPTARAALKARAADVRRRAVTLLAGLIEAPDAHPELVAALSSRFPDVRRHAASTLAARGDLRAFDALVVLLEDDDQQRMAIRDLSRLNDPRVPGALLDRIAQDPRGTADGKRLLEAIGRARQTAVVDRLIRLVKEEKVPVRPALDALTAISGYDQPMSFDLRDPDADDSWLKDQHPRHDDVIAKVLLLRAELRQVREVTRMLRGIMWSRSAAVDVPLRRMLRHADDSLRREAVFAYGWRIRFRNADSAPVQELLSHPDPTTAFLAAEALARAQASAGIAVLLAAIDTLDDLSLRRRAVLALGQLGDERALDKLLDIVMQEDHALVGPAAEAIGHLRETEKGPEILRRLLALAKGNNLIAASALVGLRWFGTNEAWAAVRRAAEASERHMRRTAADQLRYDTSLTKDDSRKVLERMVRTERYYQVLEVATTSLRRLLGPDSLEPDYALMLARYAIYQDEVLERLRERGDAARILSALADPQALRDAYDPLLTALAARDPFPVDAVVAHLADPRPAAGIDAGRLIGRLPTLTAEARASLRQATGAAVQEWQDAVAQERNATAHAERVRWLLWAAARHGVANDAVRQVLALSERESTSLQLAAARALTLMPDALEVLIDVAGTGPARARALAAAMVARHAPDRVGALLEAHRDDPAVVQALAHAPEARDALSRAVGDLHTQGLAMAGYVAQPGADPAVLAAALRSTEPDVRFGALEGLSALATPAAETHLRTFAEDGAQEEEERKAAWRALRRSRRARAAREASA